jgi:hypothetical protein
MFLIQVAITAFLRTDGLFGKMNYNPAEEFGGWYLLDPTNDGIEQIMAEECPEDPPVTITDHKEGLEFLKAVLVDWEKGSEGEDIDGTVANSEADNEDGPSQCVRKIVDQFPTTLQETFAVERHHVKAYVPVISANSDAGSDSGSKPDEAISTSDKYSFLNKQKSDDDFLVPDVPRKAGYATKQGSFFPSWKRRYFVLEDRTLFYYNDASAAENFVKKLGEMEIYSGDYNQTEVIQNGLVSITRLMVLLTVLLDLFCKYPRCIDY